MQNGIKQEANLLQNVARKIEGKIGILHYLIVYISDCTERINTGHTEKGEGYW
jgi:hypothetical protein